MPLLGAERRPPVIHRNSGDPISCCTRARRRIRGPPRGRCSAASQKHCARLVERGPVMHFQSFYHQIAPRYAGKVLRVSADGTVEQVGPEIPGDDKYAGAAGAVAPNGSIYFASLGSGGQWRSVPIELITAHGGNLRRSFFAGLSAFPISPPPATTPRGTQYLHV